MAPHRSPKKRPPLRTARDVSPHPSSKHGETYSPDFRMCVQRMREIGAISMQEIAQLRKEFVFPSRRTDRRWLQRQGTLGHLHAFWRTRNGRAFVLHDQAAYFLGLYRIAYPNTTAAEVNAFLWNAVHDGGDAEGARFYPPSQILRCED
uniref:Uncharacterized protein n=1 Tax=Corethron hystrix TaxID=216773 RepID=A0A7S1FQN7_9STRA|mmetsp:Transcript_23228/g.53073  ORF Transcript_23228/g.53073 Transcript_23228/m.53073 type:complete len:149 (+) Transcript_23228:2-448(+)